MKDSISLDRQIRSPH